MKYELNMNAGVRQTEPVNYGELRINETVVLEAGTFMELCEILAQFHALAEHLKRNRKP